MTSQRLDDLAVEVRDLSMTYGTTKAVDGLSLSVHPGTITAILGPNGAGKSTTVETCEGFRRPQAGQVRVLGLDPIADAAALRPRVGVMLQSGGAWSGIRAREMLRHMAALYANPLPIEPLIERLGLTACGRTPYRRLSGGEQQRLSLAMALVGRPELVFLDEPTAGMDPQARHATWELLGELRESGVTTVLTTHFMDEAEQLADHVYIIDGGKIVASGSPQELGTSDSDRVVHLDLNGALDTARFLGHLPSSATLETLSSGEYVVTADVNPELLASVMAGLAEQNLLAHSVLVQRQTLESRFLELTGRQLR